MRVLRDSREDRREEEARSSCGQDRPQTQDQRGFDAEMFRNAQAPRDAGVVRQVAVAPEGLRKAEKQGQRGGEQPVEAGGSEEGPVDEVVGNGIGVPPDSERDHGRERPDDEDQSV